MSSKMIQMRDARTDLELATTMLSCGRRAEAERIALLAHEVIASYIGGTPAENAAADDAQAAFSTYYRAMMAS